MPQLDLATFPPQLIWLVITFAVLYVVMAKAGLPRLASIIAARNERIEGDLERAAQLRAEAEAVIAAYEKALAEARVEAQITLRETMERLNAESAERQRKVVEELAHETREAERRIAEAKNQALASLRDMAIETTRAAALKLTGRDIDSAATEAAVDEVLRGRA